ncbi:hypothetical protein BOVA115_667 [Bacteroides ovatus]|nr:hypothetical protein BOVA115_667 [Bacteroides ovatus]
MVYINCLSDIGVFLASDKLLTPVGIFYATCATIEKESPT